MWAAFAYEVVVGGFKSRQNGKSSGLCIYGTIPFKTSVPVCFGTIVQKCRYERVTVTSIFS